MSRPSRPSPLAAARRRLVFAAVASMLVVSGGGCGRGDDPDSPELTRRTVALHGTGVTIDPGGYRGRICVIGIAPCVSGTVTTLDVPDGTYSISAPSTLGLVAGEDSLGTLTVNKATGSVTLASDYFTPGPAPASFRAITTLPMGYDAGGTLDVIDISGVGSVRDALQLLRGRRYRIVSFLGYTFGRDGGQWFSPTYDLEALSDGSLRIVPGTDTEIVFTTAVSESGPRLVVRPTGVVRVTYRSSGTPIVVALRGMPQLTAGGTVSLMRTRRYHLYNVSGWCVSPVDGSSSFSSTHDLEVMKEGEAGGPVKILEGFGAHEFFATSPTADGADLLVRPENLVRVTYQSNGTPVPVGIGNVLSRFQPGTSVLLMRNRVYWLSSELGWSVLAQSSPGAFSPARDLHVVRRDEEAGTGALRLIGEDANATFSASSTGVDAAELAVRPSALVRVTYHANGSAVPVGIGGMHSFTPNSSVLLMRNRLYHLVSTGGVARRPTTGSDRFSAIRDLLVQKEDQEGPEGPLKVVPDTDAERLFTTSRTAEGGEIAVLPSAVTPVSLQPNVTPVPVGISGLPLFQSGVPVQLLRERRYRLTGPSSINLSIGGNLLSSVPDLETEASGSIALVAGTTAAGQFRTTPGSSILEPTPISLRVTPNGHTGTICLRGITCSAAGAPLEIPVIPNRRYTVDPPGTTVDIDASGNCTERTLVPTTLVVSCQPIGDPPTEAPTPPANLSAVISGPAKVDLRWVDTSIDEAGFRVERRVEGSADWLPVAGCDLGARQTTCSDTTNLVVGTRYEYQVYAYNVIGNGYSSVLTVPFTGPNKPDTLVGDAPTTTSVALQWADRSTNEQGFRIERSDNGIDYPEATTFIVGRDVQTYVDSTVADNATYHYRVKAFNALDTSLPTNVAIIQVGAPGPPSNVQAALIDWFGSTGYVHVTWNDNSGNETGFSVERRDGPAGAFREVGVTGRDAGGAQGGYIDLVGVGTYTYRVRALSSLGSSAYATGPEITIGLVPKPVLTTSLVSGSQIDLSWTALTNASSATVYRADGTGGFASLATPAPSATSHSDANNVTAGSTYSYIVEGRNLLGASASDPVVVTVAVPPAPTFLYATVLTQTSVAINWSHVPSNEAGFRVVRTLGTGTTALTVADPAARSYTDTGRAAGQSLQYQVRAFNIVGDGPASPATAVTVPMATPTPPTSVTASIVTGSQIEIRWTDTSTNENGFKVRRRIPPTGDWETFPMTLPDVTRYLDVTAASGAAYEYQVLASNAFGDAASPTAGVTLVAPLSPAGLSATLVAPNRVDLAWTDVSYETSYLVTRATNGQDFTTRWELAAGATSFSDTTVLKDLTYTYRVVAVNGMGTSSPPSTVTITVGPPAPPATFTGVLVSATQLNLAWTVAPGSTHTSFRLSRKLKTEPDAGYALLSSPAAADRSYSNNTGLVANTEYVYRLVAVNGAGDSAPALLEISTSRPAAPTQLVAKVASTTQVNLTWVDNANSETGYRVQRSSNGTTWLNSGVYPSNDAPPLPPNTTSYSVTTGLAAGAEYYFRVIAVAGPGTVTTNSTLNSDPSTPIERIRMAAPTPVPSGLVATAISMSQVRLTWTDVILNENGFEIQHRPNAAGTWEKIGESERNVPTFDHVNLTPGSPHEYRVRAFNGIATQVDFSNIASTSTAPSCVGRANGFACEDGNLCTTGDTCQNEVCVGGAPKSCGAATTCSTFTCEPATGACKGIHKPLGTTCNDSNLCTTGDVCNGAGTCGGVPKTCSDGNACTTDTCEAATGVCQNTASTCAVTPLAACTMTDAVGATVAVFGYQSAAAGNVEMAYGPDNQLTPAEYQGRQPRWFKPGTQEAAFSVAVPLGDSITWRLGTQTVTANEATAACPGGIRDKANTTLFIDVSAELSAAVVAPTAASAATLPSLSGDLDVTATGSANYEIPLSTPAGRRGIEPHLSLQYDSGSNGNGTLGVGWRVGGLSTISRCQRTVAQDGSAAPVDFTDNDRICLDGTRLVAFSGSEYRTEGESHSRIFWRTRPNGGRYFELYTVDGRIFTYGFPNGDPTRARRARFEVKPLSPTAEDPVFDDVEVDWPLTSVRDRFGNVMDVSYLVCLDPGHSQDLAVACNRPAWGTPENGYLFTRVPDLITYTHHRPATGSQRSGQRAVRFRYSERSQLTPQDPVVSGFVAGVKVGVPLLLAALEVFAPPNVFSRTSPSPLRTYRFTYDQGHSKRARLRSLTECVGEVCRPATTFAYTDPGLAFQRIPTSIRLADLAPGRTFEQHRFSERAQLSVGDIDGDGRDDIAFINGMPSEQPVSYSLSTGEGFGMVQRPTFHEGVNVAGAPLLLDVDGDGAAEIGMFRGTVQTQFELSRWFLDFCKPSTDGCPRLTSQSAPPIGEFPGLADLMALPVDVNGDGLPEVLRTRGDLFLELQRNQAGVLQPFNVQFMDQLRFPDHVNVTPKFYGTLDAINGLDIDGDGDDEILLSAYVQAGENYTLSWRRVDGTVNAVTAGGMTNIRKRNLNGDARQYPNWFVDLNGDGLKDLVYLAHVSTMAFNPRLVTQLSTGTGFLPPVVDEQLPPSWIPSAMFSYSRDDYNVRVVDLDSDGAEELLLVDAGNPTQLWGDPLRTKMSVVRMGRDGVLTRQLLEDLPIGAHANGLAGVRDNACVQSCDPSIALACRLPSCYGSLGTGTELPLAHHLSQVLDVNGDGLTDVITYDEAHGGLVLYVRQGPRPDLLKEVKVGHGYGSAEIDYSYLDTAVRTGRERPVYDPGSDCVGGADFICARGRQWVVSEIRRQREISGSPWLQTSYSYKDGRYSRKGWGFLGFKDRWEDTSRDDATLGSVKSSKHVTYRSFEMAGQFLPRMGMPSSVTSSVRREGGGKRVEHVTTSTMKSRLLFRGIKSYQLWHDGTDVTRDETDLATGITTRLGGSTEQREPSAKGHGRTKSVAREFWTGNTLEATETVDNQEFLADNETEYLVGPPTKVVVSSVSYTSSTPLPARSSTFDYDPQTLFLRGSVREPGGQPNEMLSMMYTADAAGMVVKVTASGGGATRSVRYGYDSLENLYLQSTSDDLGLTATSVYHPAIDAPVAAREPNGVTQRFVYDLFGRLRKLDAPPGMGDMTVNHLSGPPRIETTMEGGPTTTAYVDGFGRTTQYDQTFAGGATSRMTTTYDKLGRVSRMSRPFRVGDPELSTRSEYDELGRILRVIAPRDTGGGTYEARRYEYSAHSTKIFDALGNESEVIKDGLGRKVKAMQRLTETCEPPEPPCTPTVKKVTADYVHGPFGLLEAVRIRPDASQPEVLSTVLEYDRLGRRTRVTDSNRGIRSTSYTAFDQILTTTDPADAIVTFDYDAVGRPRSRTAPEGTTVWQYDSAPNGLGRLHFSMSPEGVRDEHGYDHLGRPRSRHREVAGQKLDFAYSYDSSFGRLDKVAYPETPGWPRFEVQYGYRPITGELDEAKRVDSGATLWKADAFDASGRITQETAGGNLQIERIFGPGTGRLLNVNAVSAGVALERLAYEYYDNGDVALRKDTRDGAPAAHERFVYDDLGRLRKWQEVSADGQPQTGMWAVQYRYDETGNMKSRITSGSAGPTQTATFEHGVGPNAGPSAVTSWNITGGGVPMLSNQAISYDANRRVNNHPRVGTIAYNSFDLPIQTSGPAVTARFGYDGSGVRAYKHEDLGGGRMNMTVYAGLYEMRTAIGAPGGDSVEHVLQLVGGSGSAGQITRRRAATGELSETARYFVKDHLGSVRTVAGSDGSIERKRTDPFGNKIVNPAFPVLDTSAMVMSSGGPSVTAGFTGHEHDDALGLINMRGRIYEPLAAKFLSPDPFVSCDPQSWNAYSYVMNRPLNYVDPSGFRVERPNEPSEASKKFQCTSGICEMANACARGDGGACRSLADTADGINQRNASDSQARGQPGQGEESAGAAADAEQGASSGNSTSSEAESADSGDSQNSQNSPQSEQKVSWWEAALHFVAGAVVGATLAVGVAAIALVSAPVALAAGAVLAAHGVHQVATIVSNWSSYTDQQKLNIVAGGIGALAGGVGAGLMVKSAFSGAGGASTASGAGALLPERYWMERKAPLQVEPGIRRLREMKPSSRSKGEIYEKTTHYDQYGRQIGQTHKSSHGEPQTHPNPHHHKRNPITGEKSGPDPGVHEEY